MVVFGVDHWRWSSPKLSSKVVVGPQSWLLKLAARKWWSELTVVVANSGRQVEPLEGEIVGLSWSELG